VYDLVGVAYGIQRATLITDNPSLPRGDLLMTEGPSVLQHAWVRLLATDWMVYHKFDELIQNNFM
ncbi:hypothetical protein ACJX0J_010767, partial [Zea mays]